MPEADEYVSSHLFPSDQNVELAKEAMILSVAFADVSFLRVAGPHLPYNATRAVERNRPVRDALDNVLKGFAFSPRRDGPAPGWQPAQELAARVEAFSYPSTAAECRVIDYSAVGDDPRYLVAVSAFVQEFMSHFMWAIPAMRRRYASDRNEREIMADLIECHGLGEEFYSHPYMVDLRELRKLDECIESYLRVWVHQRQDLVTVGARHTVKQGMDGRSERYLRSMRRIPSGSRTSAYSRWPLHGVEW